MTTRKDRTIVAIVDKDCGGRGMTVQEAISEVKRNIEYELKYENGGSWVTNVAFIPAMELAINALEKQVGKPGIVLRCQ